MCVKLILPPRVRRSWLLMTTRLSASSFAGTARTLVAVGTVSEAFMFLTTSDAAPRRVVATPSACSGASSAGRAAACDVVPAAGLAAVPLPSGRRFGAALGRGLGVLGLRGLGIRGGLAAHRLPAGLLDGGERGGGGRRVGGGLRGAARGGGRVSGAVVGEELVPSRVDAVRVFEEALVHLLDEPFVRAELVGGIAGTAAGHAETALIGSRRLRRVLAVQVSPLA